MRPLVVIEGIIGAGKTTLVSSLAEAYGWEPFYEIVADNPFLDAFYADPERWAYTFQTYMLYWRARTHHMAVRSSLFSEDMTPIVMDRGLVGDAVFAEAQYRRRLMSEHEYATYSLMRDQIIGEQRVPTLIVYLDASIKAVMSRIEQRGRECEVGIAEDYLWLLKDLYAERLSQIRKGSYGQGMWKVDVLSLTWNDPPMQVEAARDIIAGRLDSLA